MVPELNIQDLTVPEPNCQDGGLEDKKLSLIFHPTFEAPFDNQCKNSNPFA